MPSKPQTADDVAALLGVTAKFLRVVLLKAPRYTTFTIPKKSGGTRRIDAPTQLFKQWQQKLADYFENEYGVRSPVHGFLRRRSILTNAQEHAKARFLLNIDLADFFPSINFGRVRGLLRARPYLIGKEASRLIANICVYNRVLPQGAPTSPVLSNMICAKMDSELKALAKRYRCTYTRYADDITFSTRASSFPTAVASAPNGTGQGLVLGAELQQIIKSNGFSINDKKVRFRSRHYRLEVTGLTVNRFPNVQRRFIRQIRAMLHAWKKYGLAAAQDEFQTKYDKPGRMGAGTRFKSVVRGKIEFVGSIRGKSDPLYWRLLRAYARLDGGFVLLEPPDFVEYDMEELKKGIVVLNDLTNAKQSTAFYLRDVGLVTCAHGIGDPKALFITEARDALDRQAPVALIGKDEGLDVAILEAPIAVRKWLAVGDESQLKQLDRIVLCGFPKHHIGADVSIIQGEFTQEYKSNGLRRLQISTDVIEGNSGGPVLNSRNQVIGVAAQGAPDSLNSVIPISEVMRFAARLRQADRKTES